MSEIGPVGGIGGVVGFIKDLAAGGSSATAALSEFRSLGGSIRTQTWFRAWGEVQQAVASREAVAMFDSSLLPDDSMFSTWTARVSGQYAYQVSVMMRDRDTGVVLQSQYTHLTDHVITPDEAIASAVDTFTSATREGDTFANQVVLGAVLTGLYATQSPE